MVAGPAPDVVTTRDARELTVLLLALLLGDRRRAPHEDEWPALLAIARENCVLLRLAARLREHPARVPLRFGQALRAATSHAEAIGALVARIEANCEHRKIGHVFLGVAENHPDVCGDLDLLVADTSGAVDGLVLDGVPALTARGGLRRRISGRTTHPVPSLRTRVEISHGRLGQLGELDRFAALVLRRRRCVRLGTTLCFTPAAEDRLLYRAARHGPLRRALRLNDVYDTVRLVRDHAVEWPALFATASATGLLPAVTRHLHHIDQIYREVRGHPLLPPDVRAQLGARSWTPVRYRRGAFQVGRGRWSGALYLRQLGAELSAGDWAAAARLVLLPVAALSGRGGGWLPRRG